MDLPEYKKPIIGYFGTGLFLIGFWSLVCAILYSICSGINYLIKGKYLNWETNDILTYVNWNIPSYNSYYFDITGLVGFDRLLKNYIIYNDLFSVLAGIGIIFLIIGFVIMIISIKP